MPEKLNRRAFLSTAAKVGAAGAVLPSAAALLAACGGGSGGGGTGGGGNGTTKLTWSYWGSPEENQLNLKVKEAFEKANPGIVIDVVWTPFAQYFQRLDSMIAGGKIPDVMFLTYIQKYAAERTIEDLGPWIKKGGVDLNDYWPHFLDAMQYRGKTYALQRDGDIDVIYFNQDHLQQAGVKKPDKTWTWDTFKQALAKLTQKSGDRVTRYGLAMEQSKYWIWMGETGGWWFDDVVNPSRCTLNDAKAIAGLEFQADLIKRGQMMPVNDQTQGGDQGVFQAGLASMIIQNPSRIPAFNQQGMKYALAPIPKPSQGNWADNSGGAGFAMSAKSKNKDAAWRFLSWLQSNKGGMPMFASSGVLFPALKSVANSKDFLKPPPPGKDAMPFMAQYAKTLSAALFPDFAELSMKIIEPGLQNVWAGQQSVSAAVPPLVQQINTYLKQKGYPKAS
jgi:multiple sugar transport system substrate-binding protein